MSILNDWNKSLKRITDIKIKYKIKDKEIIFTVRNCYNQLLEGVKIKLIYAKKSSIRTTDENGEAVFTFNHIPKSFKVAARMGIYKKTQEFTI